MVIFTIFDIPAAFVTGHPNTTYRKGGFETKKCILILLLTLLTTWLLPACTPQPEAQDPTVTPTTTAPATTAAPPVTTAPPETTEPEDVFYSDSYLRAQGFIHCGDIYTDERVWIYNGESNVISLPHCGLRVTIPEAWMGRVSIYLEQHPNSDEARLYIANTKLMETFVSTKVEKDNPWLDYILNIWWCEEEVSTLYADGCELSGFTDPYYIYFSTANMVYGNGRDGLFWQNSLIHKIGQEAYDELVGDLVCTQEMAREMITVTEADPDLAYESVAVSADSQPAFYSDSYMSAHGFELCNDYEEIEGSKLWVYRGESNTFSLPHCGITVTMPEEWMGQVSVYMFQYAKCNGRLFITNPKLMEAHVEHGTTIPWYDCMVDIWWDTIEVSSQWADGCELVEFCDPYYIYFSSSDMTCSNGGEGLIFQYALIQDIGQEAYDELVGDLVCTQEMAREMITVTEADPDLAYQP